MRYPAYLRNRYRAIIDVLGRTFMVVGPILLTPLVALVFYPDEWRLGIPFILLGGTFFALGAILEWFVRPEDEDALTYQEGTVTVLIIWLLTMLGGIIPYMVIMQLPFTQAAFEAVSGWTSTGLTTLDVENAPRIILMYRSITQVVGGAGFVIIMMSAIAGPAGIGLTSAEGRNAQLVPNIRDSANIVLRIYVGYMVFGVIALAIAGMPLFDALNHGLTAVSTGGFSTRAESIGYYDSVAIEGVILVLMWLGATNLLTVYTVVKGKVGQALRDNETRFTLVVLPVAVSLLLVMALGVYPDAGEAVRTALFEVSSAMTTAGLTRSDYGLWLDFGWMLIIVLMVIGGSTDSTAGAIKHERVVILVRSVIWEVRRAFSPEQMVNEPTFKSADGTVVITEKLVRQVALFGFFYIGLLAIGTLIIAAHGYPLRDSLFEFASAIGTTGLSSGISGADAPASVHWTLIVGMFVGRLEILAVVIGLGKLLNDLPVLLFSDET